VSSRLIVAGKQSNNEYLGMPVFGMLRRAKSKSALLAMTDIQTPWTHLPEASGSLFSPAIFLLIHTGRRGSIPIIHRKTQTGIQTRFMAAATQRYTIKDLQSRNNRQ
jgi:hypothetical protein